MTQHGNQLKRDEKQAYKTQNKQTRMAIDFPFQVKILEFRRFL